MDAPTFDNDNSEFRKGLEHAINCHSMENGSNTPDFILAQYLADCLRAFDKATQHREAWSALEETLKQATADGHEYITGGTR